MRIPRWVVGVVLLWICAISAVAGWGFLRTSDSFERLDAETDARLEASCEAGNEVRDLIRTIAKEGDIVTGITVGEAIIRVASEQGDNPPDPAVVEALRSALVELLDPALTDVVNQLPAREWDPVSQECVDVPVEPDD